LSGGQFLLTGSAERPLTGSLGKVLGLFFDRKSEDMRLGDFTSSLKTRSIKAPIKSGLLTYYI
jgi:hypothetical protein